MALVVSINGTPKGIRELSISAAQNEKARLTCVLLSPDGSDRPDIDDEIEVELDSELVFGGTIKTPTIRRFGDVAPPALATSISALDFNELADRQTVTMTIPAGNVKAAATALVPYLDGVTLDPGQADGPTIDELVLKDAYVAGALQEIATRSGWLQEISHSKVLSFFPPGDRTAPWDVSDSEPTNTVGDLEVSKTRVDYANRIIVRFIEAAVHAYAFLLATGNFSDGEEVEVGGRTYTFQTTLTDENGHVLIGGDAEASLTNLGAAISLAGGAGTTYAASTTEHASVSAYMQTSSALKVRALTAGASGNSVAVATDAGDAEWITEGGGPTATLLFGADAALTNSATVNDPTEQGLYGVYTKTIEAPNVYAYESAVALGTAVLATAVVPQRTVNYDTHLGGLAPGMTQQIQSASRFIDEECLIVALQVRMVEGSLLRTSVTALVGEAYRGNRWREWYKTRGVGVAAGSATFSGSAPAAGGGGGGGSVSVRSVYYLGGSPAIWVRSGTPTWVPADNDSGLQYEIDTAARGTTSATVRVRLRAASGSVQPRIWDVTNGTQAGIGVAVTSTSFVTQSFPVVLTAGVAEYRLELLPGTANVDVNGVGYLE